MPTSHKMAATRHYLKLSFAAAFAAATIAGAGQVSAQSLNLGGLKVNLGKGDSGGLSAGVSVGSTSVGATVGGNSVASVDAKVTDSVSANTTVGGNSVASVSANVSDTANVGATVGGSSSLVDTNVSIGGGNDGGGSNGGGNNGGGSNGGGTPGNGGGDTGGGTPGNGGGDTGGGTPGNGGGNNGDNSGGNFGGGGMSMASLNALGMQRMPVSGLCGPAGNFNAINGVTVFSSDGVRLGTVVGAYTENNNLVGVRVLVDENLTLTTNCVEYATAGGSVRADGIVLNTTVALLVATLGM